MPAKRRCWLMKSEPDVYSIEDLRRDGSTSWEGVRNYQARNSMRDDMKVGDAVLFYHSNAEPSGVAGIGRIARAAYPDHFAWDPKSHYFDETAPKAKAAADARWLMVDVGFVEAFPKVFGLAAIKADPQLAKMEVARKGSRLSVHPVDPAHFDRLVKLAREA